MKISFLLIFLVGCSYKFSNLQRELSPDQKSISIEAIYDTSGKVIPHEMLWSNLQDAFAREGHLLVLPANKADLILRTQIVKASIAQHKPAYNNKDPEDPYLKEGATAKPSDFINLKVAGTYATKETLSFGINVELWNLNTRKKLFAKAYSQAAVYNLLDVTAAQESHFLRNQEALDNMFRQRSIIVANAVVKDVIQSLYLPINTAN